MQFNRNCNIITQNIFAEHTVRRYANRTYKNISLSDLEIKKRQTNIINILKGLVDKKEIESKICIYSKEKSTRWVEIKNLTPKILKNNNKIFFKESLKFTH
jgi:hypothetical protein